MSKQLFYYIFFDPTKKGNFVFGEYNSTFEPFYVGKGTKKRILGKKNDEVENRIKLIKSLNMMPIVISIECDTEEYAFLNEARFTRTIGLKLDSSGPLLNHRHGGHGGQLGQIPWNKNKKTGITPWNKGIRGVFPSPKRGIPSGIIPWNKGKTYHHIVPVKDERRQRLSAALRLEYIVTYPNGKEELVTNLKDFCRINNLTYANMSAVARNVRQHHKNFKVRKNSI